MADGEISKPKHPGGRPSKYDKAKCTAIVECGRQGMCVAEMACELDVTRETIYAWAREIPEFSDAFTCAQELAEAYWAKQLRSGLQKPPSEFQGPANLKYMAQRFKGWSEKAHIDTRETDPSEEAETPDVRSEARKVALLLHKGIVQAE